METRTSKKKGFCNTARAAFKGFTCKQDKKNPKRYMVSEKGTECLVLELEGDRAFVVHLNKCPSSAGSATMKTLEPMCRKLGVSHIDLQDGSSLQLPCGKKVLQIYLSMLTILADGQSWYNSIGFKSPAHESEMAHNARIGRMNAREFVERTLRLHKKKCPYKKTDYWGSLDRPVREYFTDIKLNLKTVSPTQDSTDTECVKYRWLEYFLKAVKEVSLSPSKSPVKVLYDNFNLSLAIEKA
jgi:hypothetical protein